MKTFHKILIPIIILIIIAVSAIPWILGPLIQTSINKLSNKKISFEYSDSHTNIFSRIISFDSVTFSFDNVVYDSASAIFLKKLSFKTFAVEDINLIDLITGNELNIRKIFMDSPELWLNRDNTEFKKELSDYKSVSKLLKKSKQNSNKEFLFHIDEFEIVHGGFSFTDKDNRKISIQSMSLLVTDLQQDNFISGINDSIDLFNFKLKLKLSGIENISKEKYKTTVGDFIIDTKEKLLQINGLDITPLTEPDSSNPVIFALKAESVRVDELNLRDILQKKEFSLGNIRVEKANITENHYSFEKMTKNNLPAKNDTFNIFSFFKEYNIDSINFEQVNYLVVDKSNDTSKSIRFDELVLRNITIDSNSLAGITNNNLIHSIGISSRDGDIRLVKQDISLKYNSLTYNGADSLFHFKGLNLRANCSPARQDTIAGCSVSIGSAEINGLTPEILITGEGHPIDIKIDNWSADINNPEKIKFKKSDSAVFRIADKLNFNIMEISDGNLNVFKNDTSVLKINSIDFSTSGLVLYTDKKKYPDIIDYVKLECTFDGLEFLSGNSSFMKLDNFKLNNNILSFSDFSFPDNGNDNTDISLTGFKITGFDIRKVINDKNFVAGSIVLNKPEIHHISHSHFKKTKNDSLNFKLLRQNIAKEMKTFFNKVYIEKIELANGDIAFSNSYTHTGFKSSFDLKVERTEFDKNDPVIADEVRIGGVKLSLNGSDFRSKGISMKYDSAIIDTKLNKISFVNLFLMNTPDNNTTGGKENRFHAHIPKIDITEPDFNAYLYHPMSFGSMIIDEPSINLLIHGSKKKTGKTKPLTGDIPFSFFKDFIKVNNAKLNITIESDRDTTKIKAQNMTAVWFENVPKPERGISFSRHEQLHKADVSISGITLKNSGTNIAIGKIEHKVNGTEIRISGLEQSSYRKEKKERVLAGKVIVPKIFIEHPVLHKKMGRLADIDIKKINTPQIDINLYQRKEKTEIKSHFNITDSTLKPVFNFLGHFRVSTTTIGNMHLRYHTTKSNKKPVDITDMSIDIDGLNVDSSLLTSHKSFINDMNVTFHKREIVTKDSMYLMKANNVLYSYKTNRLLLDSIYVIPRYGRKEFFKKAVYQTDRISLKAGRMIVDGIDFESLLNNKIYHIEKVTLEGVKMRDHRDKRYERKPGVYKPMPQTALRSLPFKIIVDSLYVKDSYLLYGEYVPKSAYPGEVFFTDLNMTISNITNVSSTIEQNPVMNLALKTKLMDDAKLSMNIKFILNDPSDYFEYSAHLSSFDLTKMSSNTENLFGLTIKSGKGTVDVNNISGNNEVATGKLLFKYKDFKIGLYDRKKAQEVTGILSPIVSFLINGIKLRSNNPKPLGKTKIGEVYFERDPEKSILNYIWKSSMSGLLTTIGITNKQLKEAIKEKRKATRRDEKINKEFEKTLKELEKKN